MKIRQFVNEAGEFCAEIKSAEPIFVNYEQISAMSVARGLDGDVDCFYKLKYCPTTINQDNCSDDKICDGIWFYDRIISFIDWVKDDVDRDIMRRALMSSDFEA